LEKCRAGGGWQSANFLAVNLSSLITKDNRHRAIVIGLPQLRFGQLERSV
jgi:hypothetical protein